MTAERTTSRWTVLAVLCLSLLAVVIDGTIVNTALPTLGARPRRVELGPAVDRRRLHARRSPACCSSPAPRATATAVIARSRPASWSSAAASGLAALVADRRRSSSARAP